jgi:hypothetical protein
MSRMTVTGTIGAILTVVLIACSKPSSPAETQAGAASREFDDDIVFTSADGASPFAHPLIANTWRNVQKLGDEAKAAGY